MDQNDILEVLRRVQHPETGTDLVSQGMIENLIVTGDKIQFTLAFSRSRDPFAASLKKACETILSETFPQYAGHISVFIKEAPPKKIEPKKPEPGSWTGGIKHIIAVSSAKGGVGKSTVTANLAVALQRMGYRVGILDADIYGPSQPKMFGVEGYLPDAVQEEGTDRIVPAESMDIRLMSIGFFIKPTDALLWRGAMAVSALKQMIHQTKWGTLDFLLADLPPGTGDVHLSIIGELKIDAAVIVSTPQQVAVADVVRGVEMFRNENVNIPVAGVIENMAWFTPEELPENRYYIFGKGGARRYAEENGVDFLGEIPIVQSIMEGSDEGRPAAGIDPRVEKWYREIAEKTVEKVMKSC